LFLFRLFFPNKKLILKLSIVTVISGSSPDLLAGDDKKENRKRYEGCYGIETLELGQNIRQLSSW